MPIDEIEKHPFLDYYTNENKRDYTGLIVGSFPIYQLTNSLDDKIRRAEQNENLLPFFYGSDYNTLWHILATIFHRTDPKVEKERRNKAIEILQDNNLLITDVLYTTNRKDKSALDAHLWQTGKGVSQNIIDQFQCNCDIITMIETFGSIKNIFFTSFSKGQRSPYAWFMRTILCKNPQIADCFPSKRQQQWSCKMKIGKREFQVFLLPSPIEGARGVALGKKRSLKAFEKYVQFRDSELFERIKVDRSNTDEKQISAFRKQFVIECYRQAIIKMNDRFDGIPLD